PLACLQPGDGAAARGFRFGLPAGPLARQTAASRSVCGIIGFPRDARMNDHAGATTEDRRDEFLRYLSERVETIGRRVDRFLRSGWDINGIALLHSEALRLGEASREHGVQEVLLPLEKLAEAMEQTLRLQLLPDVEVGGRVCELVQLLSDSTPPPPELPDPGPLPEVHIEAMSQLAQADVAQARAHAEELFRTSGDAWGDGVQLFGKLPSREHGELTLPQARVTGHDSRAPQVSRGRFAPITPV